MLRLFSEAFLLRHSWLLAVSTVGFMPAKRLSSKGAAPPAKRGRPKTQPKDPEVPMPWVGADNDSSLGLNADIWVKHTDHVKLVLQHPCFTGAMESKPLGIMPEDDDNDGMEGGIMAVYDEKHACRALARRGLYNCAVNLLWVDVMWTPSTKIPIVWASVQELMDYNFKAPACIATGALEVGVTQQEISDKDWGAPGKWKRISAEEVVMAWFAAVARDIAAGVNEEHLKGAVSI